MTQLKELRKGQFLISEPFLMDPNFKRTVVFLCEHQEEGSMGFILNRPVEEARLEDLLEDFPAFDAPVYYGGPVQPQTLHYIHNLGDTIEGSVHVVDGVYWGGNFEAMKATIEAGNATPEDFQFFVGYSGWGPGQLADEMDDKSWINTDAEARYIFGHKDPEQLWQDVLKDLGGEFEIVANFPEDPSLN